MDSTNLENIRNFFNNLFKLGFGSESDVEVFYSDNVLRINLKIDRYINFLVGRRSKTLNAIQHLVRMICSSKFGLGKQVKVIFDVADYKSQRVSRLEDLAKNTAEKVLVLRRSIKLHPMNDFERFIVHKYISTNYPNLKTYSVGVSPGRRVVVDMNES